MSYHLLKANLMQTLPYFYYYYYFKSFFYLFVKPEMTEVSPRQS